MTRSKKKSKIIGDIRRDNPGTIHVANVTTKFKAEGILLSEDIKKHVLMIQGVKKIHLDQETKCIEVIYDPNITNFDIIKKAIESQSHIYEEEPVTTQVEKVKKKSIPKADKGLDNPEATPLANVTKKFKAEGISLSEDIEKHVLKIKGVKKIDIDYETEEVQVIFDPNITNFDIIKKAIESYGYLCKDETVTTKLETVIKKSKAKGDKGRDDPEATQVKKEIWAGSHAESMLPDPVTKHAQKVIWEGPLAGRVSQDHGTLPVEKAKKRSKAKSNKDIEYPETTHVGNITKKFKAKGMTCKNCELVIKKQVKTMPGVKKIEIDYTTEEVMLIYDPHKIKFLNIKEAIESKGYICEGYKENKKLSTSGWILTVLGIIVVAYFALQYLETIELPQISANMSYGLLFIVGLLTGLHCVSMCGGFVVSYSTKGIKDGIKPHELHLAYGLGKTISYTVIGAIFGLLGSIIAFTPLMRGIAGIFAGLFLMLFGLKMLNIFPVLRKIQFKTPEFIQKFTYGQKKSHSDPLTIGLLNGLMIACGPLQAIYIMAAGTGSMIEGAKLLFIFALGTLPVMLSFGYVTSFLGAKATHQILKFSGAVVIILGIFMINNGLALTGTGFDVEPANDIAPVNDITSVIDNTPVSPVDANIDFQEIRMDVTRAGYTPSTFTLKKGVPVKWIINGKELGGCNNAIIVPALGLEFDIKKGEQIIEFTPKEAGTIRWSCWMGMIRGSFVVK